MMSTRTKRVKHTSIDVAASDLRSFVVAASGWNDVTEFGYLSSQSVGLYLGTSTSMWSRIHSLAVCAVATTATASAALYASVDARTRRVGLSRVSRPVLLLPRPALKRGFSILQSVS
jgi:hypothetical protein